MQRFQFGILEAFAQIVVITILLWANIQVRDEVGKGATINSVWMVRTLERGWPMTYQENFESVFYSVGENEKILSDTENFLSSPPKVTSLKGAAVNSLALTAALFFVHFLFSASKRRNKKQGQVKLEGSILGTAILRDGNVDNPA